MLLPIRIEPQIIDGGDDTMCVFTYEECSCTLLLNKYKIAVYNYVCDGNMSKMDGMKLLHDALLWIKEKYPPAPSEVILSSVSTYNQDKLNAYYAKIGFIQQEPYNENEFIGDTQIVINTIESVVLGARGIKKRKSFRKVKSKKRKRKITRLQ